MGEVMTQAIIGMPYDMAMSDELSRRQFHDRAQYLLGEHEKLQAELAKLRAELERLPVDGWKLVPVERITIALESVQNAMEDAYNNAYQECCGRGQGQCCGDPVAAWSDADTAIMDALAPAQRELSALLAAAPSAPKADDPVKVELLEAVPLYAAVERACGELPNGWTIELHMENGAGWVELYDDSGCQVDDFPTDNERLDYTINDAIDAAIAAARQESGKV